MDVISMTTYTKKPEFPERTYAFCAGFRLIKGVGASNIPWTVPFSGKYRFICIAQGGEGGLARYKADSAIQSSGGGGGSGSWCEKTLELQAGESFTMQVPISYSRVIQNNTILMQAKRGAPGIYGYGEKLGTGGKGGTATGGDTNHNGIDGSPGVSVATGQQALGGNGAPVADWELLSQYLSGAFGRGGLSDGNTSQNGETPTAPDLFPLLLGAGSGGGAMLANPSADAAGGDRTPGCVIVAYVVG